MTPDLLREAGEALHGERGKAPLARALEVSERTVRRWADGTWNMPIGSRDAVHDLLLARRAAVAEVLKKLG